MPKTKKRSFNKRAVILFPWVVIAILIALCSIQAYLLNSKTIEKIVDSSPRVSLGAMQFRIIDGKATKRSDREIKELQAFLEKKGANEGCSADSPAYEYVSAYTKDESQILLKYGCGAADSSMHIAKVNGKWKSISPTNNFGLLGIPACDYVSKHSISKELAPVCVNDMYTGTPNYVVR